MTSNKVMFEIYREAGYGRKYRVVYFTEAQLEAGIGEGREMPFSLAE